MIAYGALLAWPVVTLFLVLMLPVQRAIIWSLLAAYLLLPFRAGFDFPVIPTLDKGSIPSFAIFALALLAGRGGRFRWPRSLVVNLLMAGYAFGPVLTGFYNHDPITIGSKVIPAMGLYSSLSMSAEKMIDLLPFLLGAGFLRDERSHRDMLFIFVITALAYSLPVLAEIRLSPFLQGKVYNVVTPGYFIQQVRDGGFRSMVFLGHGLLVSTFLAMAIVAAIGLGRSRIRIWGVPAVLCAAYLFVILILNKSVGALLFAVILSLALAFFKPRRILLISFLIGAVVISYPMLRANGLIPVGRITAMVDHISPERAQSVGFRFRNEDMLLHRAQERALFGWGGYSRNRIFVLAGNGSARDVTVTDGTWIIVMGVQGWLGYVSMFGLLCYPMWNMFRQRKKGVTFVSAALVFMLALNLLDLLPNSSLRPITWMLAGALSGYSLATPRRSPMARTIEAQMEPQREAVAA